MSIFDDALEKRFNEAPLITAIEVTSNDTLLIRDLETGQIMRIPVSILYSALGSAFASLIDGKVPASQLPSYVDDVLEYANFAALPGTGETGKIYVTLDTNLTYRWSGSAYVEISASLALGETLATAYRGDRGKTAYDHSQTTTGNPHGTTKTDLGLGDVDNTSDANKPVSTAQQTALNAKADKALENWIAPSLLNSWVDYGGNFNPSGYYKDAFGIVHLRGFIYGGTMNASAFILPEGYRPAYEERHVVISNNAAGSLKIAANGNVYPWVGSAANFSLDGITFRAA